MTDCAICGPAGPMPDTLEGHFTLLHREAHDLKRLLMAEVEALAARPLSWAVGWLRESQRERVSA